MKIGGQGDTHFSFAQKMFPLIKPCINGYPEDCTQQAKFKYSEINPLG